MKRRHKKGQITLGSLPNVILSLVFIGAIAIGGFLALDSLLETAACDSAYTFNTATGECELTSNTSIIGGYTFAGNSTSGIEEGLDNVFDQMATIGTLIGVGILLTVVVLGFGAARRNGLV